MPTVQMPDGSTAQFPDGMAPADIQSAIETHLAGNKPIPPPAPAPAGNTIQAAPAPGIFDRVRKMVANSAVGASLESTLPKVSSALGLTPTETVNSPTYRSDRQQVVAPQYLVPAGLRGRGASIARGMFTGAGKLTSGSSLATGAGMAATAGLAAPLAPAATALKLAGAGMGAAGVGSSLYGAGKAYLNGDTAGGDEQLGEAVPNAALMAPLAAEGAMRVPELVRGTLAGDVNAPIPGTSVTPAGRYAAMQRTGVSPDAADATNSPLLGNIKRLGENSLAGGPVYDAAKGANTAALTDSTDQFVNSLYPGDRESGGKAIQDALKLNHESLRTGAESGFDQLTQQTKGQPVAGAPAVGASAQALLNTIEPLAAKYPSLAPAKTMAVLRDLSQVGAGSEPVAAVPAGAAFDPTRPITNAPAAAPRVPDTWSDLQRLRSATHDLTTTNPDLVKSQAIAPLQQMTSSLDDGMTNGSSGLTPAQAEIFRQANAQWKDMKGTYDDPSSPLYHAVRTDTPSTLYGGVGSKTPEGVRDLIGRISPIGVPSEGVLGGPSKGGFEFGGDGAHSTPALGALRKGTVEGALKTTNGGSPNFRTFGTQLNRIPADYRSELFSPDQNSTLQDVQHTSNVLGRDFNPSGSGKLMQKAADLSSLFTGVGVGGGAMLDGHPIAGAGTMAVAPLYNAAQYGAAKAMNSPSFVNWLMNAKPLPSFVPAAAAAGSGAAVLAAKKK